jgi:SnoaL-like domain
VSTDREIADYIAITRLHSAYADAVNTRAWERLARMFLRDAPMSVDTVTRPVVELNGGEEIATFISSALERFGFFEFVTLNAFVRFDVDSDADHARARVFMCEFRQERGSRDFSRAFGVYHDDYRRTPDGWRFAARKYQSVARTGGDVFAVPAIVGFDFD